ncbi:MAG: hypothetical protein ABIG60_00285 [Patescibacteria group bacterium]
MKKVIFCVLCLFVFIFGLSIKSEGGWINDKAANYFIGSYRADNQIIRFLEPGSIYKASLNPNSLGEKILKKFVYFCFSKSNPVELREKAEIYSIEIFQRIDLIAREKKLTRDEIINMYLYFYETIYAIDLYLNSIIVNGIGAKESVICSNEDSKQCKMYLEAVELINYLNKKKKHELLALVQEKSAEFLAILLALSKNKPYYP